MKDSVVKILDQKLKDLEDIKNEFKHSKLMLKEAYEKGGISEEQFNNEMRKLKERRDAREEQVQVDYNDRERKAEKELQSKLLDKHVQEQIDLEERQMKERAKYFQNLLPESVLKRIMLEDLLEVDDQLEDFKRQKYLERDQKLKEIEDLMNGLGGLNNAQKDLGDMERRIMEKGLIAE